MKDKNKDNGLKEKIKEKDLMVDFMFLTVLIIIFEVSLWMIDISHAGIIAKMPLINLIGLTDPHITYHLGFMLVTISFYFIICLLFYGRFINFKNKITNMKKGQSAMEYLMTYGWAILIIIVVIASLYAMGVFNPPKLVPCSPCFSYFIFKDYADGTLLLDNGFKSIDNVVVTGGSILVTSFSPNEEITITNIGTIGERDITISYDVVGGLSGHQDSAIIHN